MRSLTEAEARVIALMLASSPGQEREKLRQVQLPRSTFHSVRRRAYAEGWLHDRYVPEPANFGFPRVTFLLARPFADHAEELAQTWDRSPGNVLTWGSAQVTFGVFFHESEAPGAKLIKSLGPPLVSWSFGLSVRSDQPSIAAYFDYEGLWVHLGELSGAISYPQGLGGGGIDQGDNQVPPPSQSRKSWAASELVNRPFVADHAGRAGHLVGPFGLPWSQQKLLRTGALRHRVFLDPSRIPPYRGRVAEQLTFVKAGLRSGARPEALFAALTRECQVFPFLFVADQGQVLIAAMGKVGGGGGPSDRGRDRRPVMATLQESLQGIELIQEQFSLVRIVAEHRYDRLFPRSSLS